MYDFDGTTASYIEKVSVASIDTNAYFGGAISINENKMAVSAQQDFGDGIELAGRVFIYERQGANWNLTDFFAAPDAQEGARYGDALSMVDNTLIVGASGWHSSYYTHVGNVYKYDFDGSDWNYTGLLKPAEVGSGDYYGARIDFDGKNAMIRAHFDDDNGSNTGAAYIYDLCTTHGPAQSHNICQGDSVLIDGTYYQNNGTIEETLTNAHGCDSIVEHTVIVATLPSVTANASATSICAGESITLYGSGTGTFTWDNGVNDNVAFVPSQSATYTVTGTDGTCENTDQIDITVLDLPSVTANATETTICDGESITLYGSGASTYTWDNSVSDNVEFTPVATTTYTVTGTDGTCENTAQVEITVNPIPAQPSIIYYGGMLMSSATSGNQWYYTTFLLPGETNQTLTPQNDGNYFVQVTVDGCSSMSEAYNYSSVGINNLESNTLNIYPTMVNNEITINYSGTDVYSIEILDISGKKLMKQEHLYQMQNINVSYFEKGTYLLKFSTSDTQQLIKWVKQ
ncbi:MAG: T9SS type A sorting domain-containing protein [Bacteroidales bacterium]|nr:T9SS type A sorting domain-containing protein [Bacteroidales bacterium]